MALRIVLLLGALLWAPASAHAVSARDIIELSKAGLSDEILIALIDADRTVFTLDKEQILDLRKAGVSERVLLKMLRTRREYEAPELTSLVQDRAPEHPGLVIIGAQPPPPPVTVVVPQYVVPQYYLVPFSIWGPRHAPRTPAPPVLAPEHRGFGRFINDGWR